MRLGHQARTIAPGGRPRLNYIPQNTRLLRFVLLLRKGSNATGRGNPYLGAAVGEAAISTGRTQSFLGARYRRLAKRMPKKKALVATGNSMLTIIHALLADPAACYQDLGAGYYEQRMHTRRQARNYVKNLERLGYKVTIEALNPDTSQPLSAAS